VKQVGIINDVFPERILGMVTSDDPYAYVVAKILHLSLPFCSLPRLFLFALPAHGKGGLVRRDARRKFHSLCGDFVFVCVCVFLF
jgi:hypothetical protein